ncbi:MAG: alkaline phosphatase [Geminicoccaceae bacterium]
MNITRYARALAGCTALVAFAATAQAADLEVPQTGDAYWTGGREALKAVLEQQPNTNQAKNIVLLVADGFGLSTVTAARILEGQLEGKPGEEHQLTLETLPYAGLIKTYNTNAQIPDSAGTSTAMHSGVKTSVGVISVNADVPRGDCEASKGAEITSILDMAETAGMSTGVISTARVTHATPAAAYGHSADRNWEDDADLPEGADCPDIARQLIEYDLGDGLEIAMGGGRRSFLPADAADPEDEGQTGERLDGRDLTAEWTERYGNSGAFVWNQEGFAALDPANVDHVLGLFNRSHMQYEADRARDAGGEPSLSEMTGFAIDVLSKNPEGFYLMVESGRVDHAHHETNAYRALTDAIEFDKTVETVLEKVDLSETLVVVTADHSHVFTISGYSDRGNPILGLSTQDGEVNLANDGKPYTTLGYHNGPSAIAGERADLSDIDVNDIDFVQQALVPLDSETHSGEDIAVYAVGPYAHLFQNTQEQSYIFHVMDFASKLSERSASIEFAAAE